MSGKGQQKSQPSDSALAAAASGGDTQAFSLLVSRYGTPIYNLCQRYLPPSDVEDMAQETFVRAFVHFHDFDPNRPLLPWFITIARRLCIDVLRKKSPHLEPSMDQQPSSSPNAETQVSAKQQLHLLKEGLATLPEGPRETLVLYHFEGLSYQDIAHTLDVPQGTVMTWLHRGRNRLKKLLQESQKDISVKNVETQDIKAQDIKAQDIKAQDIKAQDMKAKNTKAEYMRAKPSKKNRVEGAQ